MDIKSLISKLNPKYKNVMIAISDSVAFAFNYPEEDRYIQVLKGPVGKAYSYRGFTLWVSFNVNHNHFRVATKKPQSIDDSCWSAEIHEKDIDKIETILTFT